MESERTKLIAAGVILLAAVGVFFVVGQGDDTFPTNVNFVCVETGKQFDLKSNEYSRMPADNPDTGRRTLLPVTERDGKYYVSERYSASLMRDDLKELNKFVDVRTLEVHSEPIR